MAVLGISFLVAVIAMQVGGPSDLTPEELSAKIRRLDAVARTIPATEIDRNLRAYEELSRLAPENERYETKVSHYKAQLAVQKKGSSFGGTVESLWRDSQNIVATWGEPSHVEFWGNGAKMIWDHIPVGAGLAIPTAWGTKPYVPGGSSEVEVHYLYREQEGRWEPTKVKHK